MIGVQVFSGLGTLMSLLASSSTQLWHGKMQCELGYRRGDRTYICRTISNQADGSMDVDVCRRGSVEIRDR